MVLAFFFLTHKLANSALIYQAKSPRIEGNVEYISVYTTQNHLLCNVYRDCIELAGLYSHLFLSLEKLTTLLYLQKLQDRIVKMNLFSIPVKGFFLYVHRWPPKASCNYFLLSTYTCFWFYLCYVVLLL